MDNQESPQCAWCLVRQVAQEPQEGESHGVCIPHAEIEYMRYKLSKVPSAVNEQAEDQRRHSLYQR